MTPHELDMERSAARLVAEERLQHWRSQGCEPMAINDDITMEHPLGFVFFYNTVKFYETRDHRYALAGNGPLLVLRDGSGLIVLPSNRSAEKSLLEVSRRIGADSNAPPPDGSMHLPEPPAPK
jgi:hypothetical protein